MSNNFEAPVLSRRAFLLAAVAAGLGLAHPDHSVAIAETAPSCFEDLTVGEYLRMFSPDVYKSLDARLGALLDSSLMYTTPVTRALLTQDVSISAWRAGTGSVGYSFSFSCTPSCPSLYALVTVTNLSSNVSRSQEFWGSGTVLSGSGTAYGLGTGTCSAVVTAFAPQPPTGMSSYYSQDWQSVAV